MNLLETMRRRKVDAMIADAEFLSKQEDSEDTQEAVEQHKRNVMYELAIGKITSEERQEVFAALNGKSALRVQEEWMKNCENGECCTGVRPHFTKEE